VTVVRAEKPTSVQPGDDAIVLADGSIEGFVGGLCAEGSVRSAALDALEAGETLLLRVLPESDTVFPDSPGARVVTNPCLSGGALEMFLEPLLPAPLLGVVGDTPIAHAVRVMAGSLGFDVDDGTGAPGAIAVIVSSLGRGEHEPIRAALDAGVRFIGLVASKRRGQAVLTELRLSDEERSRIRTPVGLWIGARTAEEIALSIMAELVKAIRTEGLSAPTAVWPASAPPEAKPLTQAVDPVCGMTVMVGPNTPHLRLDDVDHWFCCVGCRETFVGTTAAEGR
jgi:xanthine dehydrogenase accessory factor